MKDFEKQLEKITNGSGFIAALDQSGGSTPKALANYGVKESAWKNETEMFRLVHQMRERIVTNPSFNGSHILGAILFENTMEGLFDGKPATDYLWQTKEVIPFLKIDKGLAEEKNGAQMMKAIPQLNKSLERAKEKNVFGTKMRSVIKLAKQKSIEGIVSQQFDFAAQILESDLIPIVEPEVDINCPEKPEAESFLFSAIEKGLQNLKPEQKVILKLTLPTENNLFLPLVNHSNVLRVVALSGGYPREEANRKLLANEYLIASFSRALTEGLKAQQTQDEFTKILGASIESIFKASL